MKFQNCILINFVTEARTDVRTTPFNFSKVGGIMKGLKIYCSTYLLTFLGFSIDAGVIGMSS